MPTRRPCRLREHVRPRQPGLPASEGSYAPKPIIPQTTSLTASTTNDRDNSAAVVRQQQRLSPPSTVLASTDDHRLSRAPCPLPPTPEPSQSRGLSRPPSPRSRPPGTTPSHNKRGTRTQHTHIQQHSTREFHDIRKVKKRLLPILLHVDSVEAAA